MKKTRSKKSRDTVSLSKKWQFSSYLIKLSGAGAGAGTVAGAERNIFGSTILL
jgi:hypothetical protein